jgi:hypothetical protein
MAASGNDPAGKRRSTAFLVSCTIGTTRCLIGPSGVVSSSPSSGLPVQRPVAGSMPKPKMLFSLRRRSPLFSRLIVAPEA